MASIAAGVLGGATNVLYGMIGILGTRIWVQNKVDFSDAKNLTTAAVALVVGIANFTWAPGNLEFGGIALGTALGVHHLMRVLEQCRGTGQEPAPGVAPYGRVVRLVAGQPADRRRSPIAQSGPSTS